MPAPPIDDLDDDVLAEHYDSGALARGRTYAAAGRIQQLGAEPGRLRAVCQGSHRATYLVTVLWDATHGAIDIDDACTCPLRGGCKHCVAAIVSARRRVLARHDPPGPAAAPAPVAAPEDWRGALAPLAHDEARAARGGLALQVLLHRRPSERWHRLVAPRVTVRPLRRGRGGGWITTGASWRQIASRYARELDDADPRQRAALESLAAACTVDLRYEALREPPLEMFGPELWPRLRRAVDAGVQLVGPSASDVVELAATPAEAVVDLTADAAGTVTLTTWLELDGTRLDLDADRLDLLGDPHHGLWLARGDVLHLVPLATSLEPAVVRLARGPAITVPARDVDDLLDTYVPGLALQARVGSSDGSVTTTATLDGLVLAVERTALAEADTRWRARYRRGARTVLHDVGRPGGRGRDHGAEAALLRDVALPDDLVPGLLAPEGSPRDATLVDRDLVRLLSDAVPLLEAAGVEVDVRGDQPPLRAASGDPLISLVVRDGEATRDGNDWFDLGVQVSIDGEVIDFVTLFAALDRGDEVLVLPSGTWLPLDQPELIRLRELIEEAQGLVEVDEGGDAVARVNRFQTSWWDELADLGVVDEQSARWAAQVGSLRQLASPEPIAPPAGLHATLRPYQQEGLDWLAFLHRAGLGGILADDMGLGKTVQTLGLFAHVHERDPSSRFLVVAPTSVVEGWAREAERFAPDLRVRTIRQTRRRRGTALAEEIRDADVLVTSYALFRLEHEEYAAHRWDVMVLDEAQFVKNHQSKAYQCARRIDAGTKVAVTGTPLENSLMDLWSLLSITAPGLYPDPDRFSDTYRRPIERGEAPELLATLRRRIAPLMRRRTKDEVLTELPPKVEQVVEVELGARHARIYQTQLQRQRQKVLGLVDDVQAHRFEILRSLTLLRQLALDPGLVDEADDDVGSAKLDRLLIDLAQVVAEGHRALVFSQFTRFLGRLRTRLDTAGIAHSYLDGRTRDRAGAIARFKDGEVPVFVISLKAGGFGLNLTEADYCFVLDPWWNPATETQAVDRAHRIGQQNPVMVYRYLSVGTIEEKVMELKARKASLFADVVDADGALSGPLTAGDIRGLLDL